MKCKKCGAGIPEGKIYCEICGTAIQMVPDYNPVDDISIGTEEKPKKSEEPLDLSESDTILDERPMYARKRFWFAFICLIVVCTFAYQISYRSIHPAEVETEEPEEVTLLEEPTLSVASGTYDYAPQLVLSHPDRSNGEIYYTTDGTTPDADSQLYNHPIEIGEGKTIIRAVFIRSDGVVSEEACGTYEVVFQYPDEPVFSISSGEYEEPFTVSIRAEADCQIYYTTNGEDPDRYSSLYRGPITINPGLTVLRAVAIDADGGESGIMEAIYKVYENTEQEEMPVENTP
jgi:uncharacterized Zn finger protein (UPF0148 family)